MQQDNKDLAIQIDSLNREAAVHRESIQGLNTLRDAHFRLWSAISDMITQKLEQLRRYEGVKDQVNDAFHRLKNLDFEMFNREELGKIMLVALEKFSAKELEAIGVTDRRNQMKCAHKILKKIALINEARTMMNNLGHQCQEYR